MVGDNCCRCCSCDHIDNDFQTFISEEVPAITSDNTVWFGGAASLAAGIYVLRYCKGAFNYRDGWVTTRVPSNSVWNSGQFLDVKYNNGSNTTHFAGPDPGVTGWTSQDLAEAAANCLQVSFAHTSGKIGIEFSDNDYTDNTAGSPNPTYALYRVIPSFEAYGIHVGASRSGGRVSLQVYVKNTSGFAVSALFTVVPSGDVVSPTGPTTLSFSAGEVKALAVEYDDPAPDTSYILTIRPSVLGVDYPDLEWDLTPVITGAQSGANFGPPLCGAGTTVAGGILVTNSAGGNTDDLVLTLTSATGCSSPTLRDPFDVCTTMPTADAGYLAGLGDAGGFLNSYFFYVAFIPLAGVTSVIFNFSVADGSLTHPPISVEITL